MFEVSVVREFRASHGLRGYRGEDEPIHEHRWRVEVVVATAGLGPDGTAWDFVALAKELDALLAELDGANLNEHGPFRTAARGGEGWSPSAEKLAVYAFERLQDRGSPPLRPARVRVWETDDCSATYIPE